jgi:rod shape determining protein RodA
MKRDFWKHFDFWLFGTVVILTIFGVVMIRSAIAGNENLTDLVSRQTIWAGITIGVILVVGLVDYHYYAALSRPMYIATAALLAVIFVIGEVSFGARRWLDTGLFFIHPPNWQRSSWYWYWPIFLRATAMNRRICVGCSAAFC